MACAEIPDLVGSSPRITKRVPLSLLSSASTEGKAKLLFHILHGDHGKKVVVLESPFEEYNEDSSGEQADAMEWTQFPNGCIHLCVRYDLDDALEYLQQHSYPFECIVLDTEGLVHLTPFAAALWEDEELGSRFYLDGIISVLDFDTFAEHLATDCEEIAVSDCVLIYNMQEDQNNNVKEKIRRINQSSKCTPFREGEIDLNKIFSIDSFGVPGTEVLEEDREDTINGMEDPSKKTSENEDLSPISSICLFQYEPVDKGLLSQWFAELIWENEEMEILRTKGIVHIVHEDCRFILHELGEMFELSKTLPWGDSTSFTKLIITGKNLNLKSLQSNFKSCSSMKE